MLFEEVLPAFRKGQKIRRRDWEKGFYLSIDTVLLFGSSDFFAILTTPQDILDDTWEIIFDYSFFSDTQKKGEIERER